MWDYKYNKKKFIIESTGIGLVELLISIAVVTIIIVGILLLQGKLMHGKVVLDREDLAHHIAVQRLENVLAKYPYGSMTTMGSSTINTPPLFNTITKVNGIEYLPVCNITDNNDPFDDKCYGGNDSGTSTDDYKEIKITVTYPIQGTEYPSSTSQSRRGTYTVIRYLYNINNE